jgi:hypothetical protein
MRAGRWSAGCYSPLQSVININAAERCQYQSESVGALQHMAPMVGFARFQAQPAAG